MERIISLESRRKLGGININGRWHYFDRLQNLKQVTRSRWTVERKGFDVVTYTIEGGRHAGGTRRDWYLDGGDFNRSINCTSLVDALKLLENM